MARTRMALGSLQLPDSADLSLCQTVRAVGLVRPAEYRKFRLHNLQPAVYWIGNDQDPTRKRELARWRCSHRSSKDQMKAVVLAGGLGTRLSEETTTRPKPMVEIGGRPI